MPEYKNQQNQSRNVAPLTTPLVPPANKQNNVV